MRASGLGHDRVDASRAVTTRPVGARDLEPEIGRARHRRSCATALRLARAAARVRADVRPPV